MKQDQLEKARQTRWRQDGNALLTLDDAERWLRDTPLCLYLPRYQHLPVPAPSFVEAVAGSSNITPTPDEIAAAAHMLARLVASGAVIALNLFGAAPGIGTSSFVGEHPDFLATPEALPYLYALQPERNPKRPPTTVGGARVSPLAAEAYALLEREGALTTIELRSRLGREVTEAAVLRALAELWHTMRVVPVPAENGPEGAHWELLSARHRRELNIGSTQSQGTALSILASFYLQSAVAATGEQVEIFLSPLAARSRIREVVHGLSATRQLASFPLNGEEQFYVEGTLPEIAEEEEAAATTVADAAQLNASVDAGLEQNEPSFAEAAAGTPVAPRKPIQRPSFSNRARGRFTPREEHKGERPPRREGGFRRPQRSGGRAFGAKPAGAEEGTTRPSRPNFERRGRPGPSSESSNRPDRFARGGPSRGGPSRPGFSKPSGSFERRGNFGKDRPPRPAGGGFRRDRPAGDRPPRTGEGAGRFAPGGGRPPFRSGRPSEGSGERPSRPFPPRSNRGSAGEGRSSYRPNRPSGPGRSSGPDRTSRPDRPFRKPSGDRPPGGPRRFDSRPPRRDGPFKRPYSPEGDRRPERSSAPGSIPPGGERPERAFTPRPRPSGPGRPQGGERGGRPFRAGGQRPGRPGGFSKPGARPGPFGKSGSFGKPSFAKPRFSKPSGDRPAAGGDRPDRPRSPRPAFGSGQRPPRPAGGDAAAGPRKPGGFRKTGGTGTSFGKPRPAGKGRTSTTTSSGKPRRPGGFGAPRPASGGPPKKGGFKPGGFKSGGFKPKGQRPRGSAPPKRKPRGESREGDEG